ncbi:carbon monoxide dehydrogenase subunit G [Streptomyces sp. NBC_01803]|uniref:carbon monoxide dehydrogenase subunit G n=1 Tax=Streptomyces sp. NBC_01803 TaxID=2975946 RepID=UPI002DD9E72E|nr:carbon monoxide dehydrogenase subunit G [Streptomyces sp. NBC_01803]WSA45077.1 carbon monoxide dehydrogenase subunit G [Streptomyces sp. NBC_01803]
MEHEVFLPYAVTTVRSALAEPGLVTRCVPGFLPGPDADPARPEGRLRVRIGSSTITYRGTLTLSGRGEGVTAEAEGTEARGSGMVSLILTAVPRAVEDGSGTTVAFSAVVEGKGRIGDFTAAQREAAGRRLLDRFAEALAEELTSAQAPPAAVGGIGEPDDNERVIPGIPAAPEPEPEPEAGFRTALPDIDIPPPALDPEEDEEPAVAAAAGPEPEADFARRTMIGRSAEEVDHAPPRGRYAPEPAPGSAPGTAVRLRWAAPAAAVALASAVLAGRALRRRR